MIVSLNKNYGSVNYKKGEICIAVPYNWYGNNNGWDKNDPEAPLLEKQEQEQYKTHPSLTQNLRTYWNQERGYVIYSKNTSFGCIVSWSDARWNILNIDGEDQSVDYGLPKKALEVFEKYLAVEKSETVEKADDFPPL